MIPPDHTSSKNKTGKLEAISFSLATLLFSWPWLVNLKNLGVYDWDYFFSYYESLRITLLNYHQFPWWNPWVAGGVPLFANPQIGVFSFQTLFALAFGTVVGIKISVALMYLLGFWGMYCLNRMLKNGKWLSMTISYVWIGTSFITSHTYVGHYTFLLYLLTPWLIVLYLLKNRSWHWAALFGLGIAIFVNSSFQYITIQLIVFFGVAAVVDLVINRNNLRRTLISYLIAGAVVLPTCVLKITTSFEYVSQFPREITLQPPLHLATAIKAFLLPAKNLADKSEIGFGWWEISSYIGIGTFLAFLATMFQKYKRELNWAIAFSTLAILTFLIGLGPFAALSPYNIISHLPIFNLMQVSTRWFGWTILFILLAIASSHLDGKRYIIVSTLLSIAVIELFINTFSLGSPFTITQKTDTSSHAFEEYDGFDIKNDQPIMLDAIMSGYGEVRGYEPILGYDINRKTNICGINKGCELVSKNATVLLWTPNKIILRRVSPGTIELNINPSSYWMINGKRLYGQGKIVEPQKQFEINDPSSIITLVALPPL